MSHFANIKDGIVVNVIVAEQDFVDAQEGEWVQTSYNTRGGVYYDPTTQQPAADQSKALRKNYAGIGWIYDKDADAFYPPKPERFPSFVLDPFSFLWVPPVPKPEGWHVWIEESQEWVEYEPNELDMNGKPSDIS